MEDYIKEKVEIGPGLPNLISLAGNYFLTPNVDKLRKEELEFEKASLNWEIDTAVKRLREINKNLETLCERGGGHYYTAGDEFCSQCNQTNPEYLELMYEDNPFYEG